MAPIFGSLNNPQDQERMTEDDGEDERMTEPNPNFSHPPQSQADLS